MRLRRSRRARLTLASRTLVPRTLTSKSRDRSKRLPPRSPTTRWLRCRARLRQDRNAWGKPSIAQRLRAHEDGDYARVGRHVRQNRSHILGTPCFAKALQTVAMRPWTAPAPCRYAPMVSRGTHATAKHRYRRGRARTLDGTCFRRVAHPVSVEPVRRLLGDARVAGICQAAGEATQQGGGARGDQRLSRCEWTGGPR